MPAQRQIPPHAADPDGTHDSRYLRKGVTAVTTGDIADGAVTGEKIAANAVSSVKIAPNAISATKILDSSITQGKLAGSSVVTGNIVDEAVTTAKLDPGVSGAIAGASAHLAQTAAHGATGAVVGTTNTQTLTNKTLTTPAISNFTSAQHSHGNAASGGQIPHSNLSGLDTDSAPTALHHTLGTGANQAAAGNHNHDSTYVKQTSVLANSATIGAFSIPTSPGIATKTIAVVGAAVGDVVALGVPVEGVPGATKVMPWAYVSAADTVTIMFFNVGASQADIPQAVWKVKVFK